jgi:hypothetical protein
VSPRCVDPARLLRWYPPKWRERYGEEFLELLRDDAADRPPSWRTTADVIGNGLVARIRSAGITGPAASGADAARTGLASIACAAAIFLTFGVTMWSQVVVGWRWEPPGDHAVTVAMLLMSSMTAVAVVLVGLAAVPVLGLAVGQLPRRARLAGPLLAVFVGAAALVVGSVHFSAVWPGTGGHPWRLHALVPAPVASVAWAATLGISSYWAHPTALQGFPAGQLAWMLAAPASITAVIAGFTLLVRRTVMPSVLLRYESVLARLGVVAMTGFLAGATSWVVAGGAPGPTGIYRVGVIDIVGLLVLALTATVGIRAGRRMRAALA